MIFRLTFTCYFKPGEIEKSNDIFFREITGTILRKRCRCHSSERRSESFPAIWASKRGEDEYGRGRAHGTTCPVSLIYLQPLQGLVNAGKLILRR